MLNIHASRKLNMSCNLQSLCCCIPCQKKEPCKLCFCIKPWYCRLQAKLMRVILMRVVGVDSHLNMTGLLAGNFEKNPKRYQDPVLWVWLEFFSPLRGTNFESTYYLLSYGFRLNTLKGIAKAPALLLLNTLIIIRTLF